ncbi:MAG: cupin domain-containing protein [Gemmatimonadales bacterium]
MHSRAQELIRALNLRPHPEGGHYAEVFRSGRRVRPLDRNERAAVTTIYFLLCAGEHSRWHRVRSDEVWHWYEGDPLELVLLDDAGLRRVRLGPTAKDTRPVAVVDADCWQAARPLGNYTLVGCTVAPGFEFEDFALMADELEVIERLRGEYPEVVQLV